jgi:hypothetical protein
VCAGGTSGRRPGQEAADLYGGQRDHARVGGRRLVGPDRGRSLVSVLRLRRAAVTAQMGGVFPWPARCAGRSRRRTGPGTHPGRSSPSQPGTALPRAISARPRGSAGSGSPAGLRARSSSETPAPGAQVAADQQAVLRGGGSQPGPAVPALARLPFPAERTSRKPRPVSGLAASAQVNRCPLGGRSGPAPLEPGFQQGDEANNPLLKILGSAVHRERWYPDHEVTLTAGLSSPVTGRSVREWVVRPI